MKERIHPIYSFRWKVMNKARRLSIFKYKMLIVVRIYYFQLSGSELDINNVTFSLLHAQSGHLRGPLSQVDK